MNLNMKPERAISFTKMSVYLICSWPLPESASKITRFWFKLRWWIVLISLFSLFLPLVNGVYSYRDNTLVMVKAFCLSSATGQAILKVIICRHQSSNFRILLYEMENFIKNASTLEKKYIQKYINKAAKFHAFVTTSMWLVCLDFIIEPILLSQKFPTDVAYPFPTDNKYLHIILYIQQIITLFFIASALTVDFQVATLLWFSGMRFEILSHHIKEVSNVEELKVYIRNHQHVLWYANKVKQAVKYITLSTIATTTVGVVCGCLTLISQQPLSVKLRIGNIVGNAAVELFIYAWPADNLIRTSESVGWDVYCCNWLNGSQSMLKMIFYVIQRSQKPVTIYIRGFIPRLSLQYYTGFLSSTFSYFTTMRIIYSSDSN